MASFKHIKTELSVLDITLTKQDGQYRVNYLNGSNATATVHDNLVDAYETGKAQSHIAHSVMFVKREMSR